MSDDPLYWWGRAEQAAEGEVFTIWPPQPPIEMVISHVDWENKRVFFEEGDPMNKTPYRIGPKFPPVAEGAPMGDLQETPAPYELPVVGSGDSNLDSLRDTCVMLGREVAQAEERADTERHGRLKLRRELRRVNQAVLKHKLLAERAQAEAQRVVELNQKLATGELYRDIGKVQASADQRADELVYAGQRRWASWFGIDRFALKGLIANAITEAIYADRLIRTAPATAEPKP